MIHPVKRRSPVSAGRLLRSSPRHSQNRYRRFSRLIFNPKSEITNAILAANNFGYAYDPIGNRVSDTSNSITHSYSANSLNQYTQISDGETNFPTYDLDGNMLTYNGWTFSWNGENRLVQASNSEHVISYAYDYQGRMFQKVVDGATNSYVWDGFNIVAEIQPGQTNFNVWGLDLSGTLQGAGGIGGLLSVTRHPTLDTFVALADGNGNVTEYVTIYPAGGGTNGTVVAHREYSAFGETLALTGPKKDEFTFWFSTKPYDPLTGVSHYQLRDYWAEIGRWLSEDPMVENNASYAFVKNNPLNEADVLGLVEYRAHEAADCDGTPGQGTNLQYPSVPGYIDGNSGAAAVDCNAVFWHRTGFVRLCDTDTHVRIEARTDCPGKHSVSCIGRYAGFGRGYQEGVLLVKFKTGQWRGRLPFATDRRRGSGWVDPRLEDIEFSGVDVMYIGSSWVEIGIVSGYDGMSLPSNLIAKTEGWIHEHMEISCTATYIGQ